MDDEQKFRMRLWMSRIKIFLLYMVKEPYFEVQALVKGYYTYVLTFWASIAVLAFLQVNNIGGWKTKLAILLVLSSYLAMFWKSGKWREYYQKEFVEGKKVLEDNGNS